MDQNILQIIAEETHGTFIAPDIIQYVAVEEIEDWLEGWFCQERYTWHPHPTDGVTWKIEEVGNETYRVELMFS